MDLYEWTKEYIRFRDVMRRRIKETKELEGEIEVVEKKDIIKTYIIREQLEEGIEEIQKHKKEEHLIITTLNTAKNVEELIKKWDKIITFEDLTIIFVNISMNETWLIHPKTHEKISEDKHLRESIETLFKNTTSV